MSCEEWKKLSIYLIENCDYKMHYFEREKSANWFHLKENEMKSDVNAILVKADIGNEIPFFSFAILLS